MNHAYVITEDGLVISVSEANELRENFAQALKEILSKGNYAV